jgi:hypothetical protein
MRPLSSNPSKAKTKTKQNKKSKKQNLKTAQDQPGQKQPDHPILPVSRKNLAAVFMVKLNQVKSLYKYS